MPSETICHHCGRNYAPEYWDSADPGDQVRLEPPVDPRVCPTCSRDTNPDAGPSSWVRPTLELGPVTVIVRVGAKRCLGCGAHWQGNLFGEAKGDEVSNGWCRYCLDKDELLTQTLTARRVEAPVKNAPMARPTRTYDGLDD